MTSDRFRRRDSRRTGHERFIAAWIIVIGTLAAGGASTSAEDNRTEVGGPATAGSPASAGADATADTSLHALPLLACGDSLPAGLRATWLPARSDSAMTGTAFAELTRALPGRERQRLALEELRHGNIPDFLRNLKPVRLQHRARDGRMVQAIIWVTPDYLSIGSNEDFLRIPLTRPSAVIIAEELGSVLPTRKIVDAIKEQSEFRFSPRPLPPGPKMRSSEYYLRHNRLIEEQHRGRPLGELVAGHKKDVVLTNRLLGPERIAIYGWHRKDGNPIQRLSTVHEARYADYSHGIRLVYEIACVDGKPRSIYDILADPAVGPVLSYEGIIPKFRSLMRWPGTRSSAPPSPAATPAAPPADAQSPAPPFSAPPDSASDSQQRKPR